MRDDVIIEDLRRMSQANLPWQQLNGKTVLVTGATGMLASYVTWLLLCLYEEAGVDVLVAGSYLFGKADIKERIEKLKE